MEPFSLLPRWRLFGHKKHPHIRYIISLSILAILSATMSGCSVLSSNTAASAPSTEHTASAVQNYNHAETLRTAGHCESAIPLYLLAVKQNSMYVNAYRRLGDCYQATNIGDYKTAILMYDKAIQIDPRGFGIYLDRAGAEVNNGNSGAAITDDLTALRFAPQQVPSFVSIANAFGEATDLGNEIVALTKAIAVAPSNPSLYQQRANVYLSISDPGHAIKDYNSALQVASSKVVRVEIYSSLADLYSGQQDYDSASTAMNAAIGLQPQNASLYVKEGGIRQNATEFTAALGLYDQALRYAQTSSDIESAHEGKGDAFVKLGLAQNALTEYAQAAGHAKDSATQARLASKLADQADTYGGQQDYHSALVLSALSIKLQPKNARFYIRAGALHQNIGKYAGALNLYTKAVRYARLQPDAEAAYEGQGDAYAALGQNNNASTAYKRASSLASDPSTQSRLTSKLRTIQAGVSK